ncbi:MAG TPA: CBS domain-containing protein [Sedimentisphaerales bacterium]|nr:CBS domain-containing protein [Sedimentisphaerales bacterium]
MAKKNKKTANQNNHIDNGISALKNTIADHSLGNREVSDSISKMINSPVVGHLKSQSNRAGIGQCSSDALDELRARDIMQREICWCGLDTSIEQAMEEFKRYQCSYIAVGENNNLQGFLSHKDLLEAKSPYLKPEFAKWRRPIDYASLKIKIKWLVKDKRHEVVSSDENLKTIMQKMLWTKSRCIAVIDKFEKFVGIITVEDIFDNLLAYHQKIREERTQKVKDVAGNSNISKAIMELLEHSK